MYTFPKVLYQMASKSHVLKLDMGKGSGFPRVEFTNCRSYVSKAPRWNHVKKNEEIFGGVAFFECRLSPVVNTEYHAAITISMAIFIFLSLKY